MTARWIGMACWEISDAAGSQTTLIRSAEAGRAGMWCECGAVWEARSPEPPAFCPHMEAVRAAVERYWQGRQS